MNKTRVPWRELIPAWYEIGIHEQTTIVVKIHHQALSLFDILKPDSPIVLYYVKKFGLPTFVMPTAEHWGYAGVISRVPDEEGWVTYHCPLPVYKKRKEKNRSEENTAGAVRATLSILFGLLTFNPDEDTDSSIPQLVIVDNLLVENGLNGGSLTAVFTPGMNPFLSGPTDASLESVRRAMITADEYMWQDGNRSKLLARDFRVSRFEPTRLHLCVPGNACGLDPASNDGAYHDENRGYRLVPHNVDGGIQQLSLLMGLARLCELGRTKYI